MNEIRTRQPALIFPTS